MSMSLSYGLWAMTNFNNQNFLICGKTIGSLRRNVIFTWKLLMKSEGYSIKEIRTENLLIVSKGGTVNRFYLFGGKDESSQDLIQGITSAGALFDEVVLMPESFVNQATARCSVEGSKLWFNCNPGHKKHWFNTNWIAKADKKNLIYLHFIMDDNLSLSEKTKEKYRNRYIGMFFKRFILGQWVTSDGLIYDMFDEDKHTFTELDKNITGRRYIAIDYGTTNPMVFLDILDSGKEIYILNEYYYDSKKEQRQKTDSEYADDFDEFLGDDKPYKIIIDPSALSFKAELKARGYRGITNADNTVLDGIRMTSTLFSLNLIKIHKECVNLIGELLSYVWDEKASQRGVEQPLKEKDHANDSLRYFIKTILVGRSFKNRVKG